MDKENKIILYQDDNEITRVAVRFADEDVWLTQNQLAEIYDTTKQNISQHIENILKDGELDAERTVKDFLTVRQEGNRQVQRSILHYNLDMVIARALDEITNMKILSRIEGDESKIYNLLDDLKNIVKEQLKQISGKEYSSKKMEGDEASEHSLSLAKLEEMEGRLIQGYTSFWN